MIKELQEQNSLLYLTLQSQVNTVERASKYEKNENGLYSKLITKEQTPEDGFVYQNKEHIEEELKKQGHDMDSEAEKEKVRKEFAETINNGFEDVTASTFTKEHFRWFAKYTIPIYCVITSITSLFISIFVNIIWGIIVLGICIVIGVFYYYIVSKIFKH